MLRVECQALSWCLGYYTNLTPITSTIVLYYRVRHGSTLRNEREVYPDTAYFYDIERPQETNQVQRCIDVGENMLAVGDGRPEYERYQRQNTVRTNTGTDYGVKTWMPIESRHVCRSREVWYVEWAAKLVLPEHV